jgi:iron transport multicopper oxidase
LRTRRSYAVALLCLASIAFALICAGAAAAAIVTNSSEDLRTGWYPEASSITPQLVGGGTFGQMWSAPVTGQVYAQPLLANGTLLVATEENDIYGFDPSSGAQRWSRALGTAWKSADIECGDLAPKIGVTSTPVVDEATGIAYLTHKTYVSGSSGEARWYMDAVSMSTGAEQPGFPVELSGTAQNDPEQKFMPTTQLQRPGLLLLEGVVYAGFGSDCDFTPYQGWVFGVSTAGQVKARWVDETGHAGGGIWQSGSGLASDGAGTILLSTGNGAVPQTPTAGHTPPANLGQSVVRLRVQSDGSLKATDFFAPYEAQTLDTWDADFGSGGVTGLPSAYFGTPEIPHLAVEVGKDGYVYLLNRDNLGGFAQGPSGADEVVQRIGPYGGVWSRPGIWPGEGGWVYIPTASGGESASGSAGNLRVYQYGLSGSGKPTLALRATSKDAFGFTTSAPVITSEGTNPGTALVWLVWSPNGSGEGAQLRAYDPIPNSREEPVLAFSAPVGTSAKFATPGVGAGKLFVGTRDGHVLAFGSPVTPIMSGAETVFPTTTIGSTSHETARLTANQKLTLSSLASSSSQFVVGAPSPSLPATLDVGDKIEVPIAFTPTATGSQGATLTAKTSEGNTVTFSLSGSGQSAAAQIEASPPVVTFGGTSVGTKLDAAATVRNVGGEPLTIEHFEAPAAPFSAEEIAPGTKLASGASISLPVSFAPSAIGTFESAVTLDTSGGDAQIVLVGSAGAPGKLEFGSEAIDFGETPLGGGTERSFTIENVGGESVEITKSKPPTGGVFTATSALSEGTTIAPGELLTESVRFAPTSAGAAEAVWQINGNDTSGLHEVHFRGIGSSVVSPGKLKVESEMINFGEVAVGESAKQSFTIEDVGGESVEITNSQPPTGEFAAVPPLPPGTIVSPGKPLTEQVTFAPTSTGAASAVWQVGGDDGSGLHEVSFSGVGVISAPPDEQTVLAALLSTPGVATSPAGVVPPTGHSVLQTQAEDAALASASLTANGAGTVAVKLSCKSTQTACAGTVTLQSATASSSGHASKQRKPAYATLAKASYRIAPGHTATLKLKLTAAARRLLARLRVLRVRAVTVVDGSAGGQPSRTVVLVTLRAQRARAQA